MSENEVPEGRGNKDDTYWKVLNSAIYLDFHKGHLRWTITDLSRHSGITRSLIYYYFGKEKLSILKDATQIVGDELFGVNDERQALWRDGKIAESVLHSRTAMSRIPELSAFYFTHRARSSEIGEVCREMERKYVSKLQTFFPGLCESSAFGVFAVFFGLVVAPNVTDKTVISVVNHTISALRDDTI